MLSFFASMTKKKKERQRRPGRKPRCPPWRALADWPRFTCKSAIFSSCQQTQPGSPYQSVPAVNRMSGSLENSSREEQNPALFPPALSLLLCATDRRQIDVRRSPS